MLLNMISVIVLASLSAYMFVCARFERTRQIAIVPALMSAIELYVADILSPTSYPILTAILLLLKVGMIVLGITAIQVDRNLAQKRNARRKALRKQMQYAQSPISIVPMVEAPIQTMECA